MTDYVKIDPTDPRPGGTVGSYLADKFKQSPNRIEGRNMRIFTFTSVGDDSPYDFIKQFDHWLAYKLCIHYLGDPHWMAVMIVDSMINDGLTGQQMNDEIMRCKRATTSSFVT